MKTITETLGVARSNVVERRDGKRPKRGPQSGPAMSNWPPISAALSTSDRPTGTGGSPRSSSASGDPTVWPRSTPSASTG